MVVLFFNKKPGLLAAYNSMSFREMLAIVFILYTVTAWFVMSHFGMIAILCGELREKCKPKVSPVAELGFEPDSLEVYLALFLLHLVVPASQFSLLSFIC